MFFLLFFSYKFSLTNTCTQINQSKITVQCSDTCTESYIACTGAHRQMTEKREKGVAAYNSRFMFLHSPVE